MENINNKISELQKKKQDLLKSLETVDEQIKNAFDEQFNQDVFENVEVFCSEPNRIYVFRGGFYKENPSNYMQEFIERFCKINGFEIYNIFIEKQLDSPWYYILVVDFNGLVFDKMVL